MNLSQLITAVYTETNRPDLVQETLSAVLEATLSVHTVESFFKDIEEANVVFESPTNYIQILDTSSLPLLRSIAYIRKTNPVVTSIEQTNSMLPANFTYPSTQFNFITRVDIGDVLDSYGYEKRDIWYQAGRQINIKSSTPLQYAVVGWYAYPNLDATGVNYNSWIAREMPYVIVYKAAAGVFAKIGENNSWAIYYKTPIPGQGLETGGLYYQQLKLLMQNNILADG